MASKQLLKSLKPLKPKGETRTSFMLPALHQDISDAISNDISSTWFNKKNSNRDCNIEYSTHVMGSFICKNGSCSNDGWTSKKVAVLIRGYPRNGYNAVIFNQRCRFCKKLGAFTLDKNSYVERITYRLKKWAGIEMEQEVYVGQDGPPHQQELCEGCKRGFCQRKRGLGF